MNEKIVVNSNQIITGFGNKIKKHDEQFISIEQDVNKINAEKMDKNTTKISLSQIDKNVGKIDETFLSQELLSQITGNTPISSTVAKNSITKTKLTYNSVSSEHIDFINKSSNIINIHDLIMNSSININDGSLVANDYNHATQLILIQSNTNYTLNKVTRYALYNEDGAFIKTELLNSLEKTINTENACFIRLVISTVNVNVAQMNLGSELMPYDNFEIKLSSNDTNGVRVIPSIKSIDNECLKKNSVNSLNMTIFKKTNNLFNKNNVVLNKKLDINGELIEDSEYLTTNYFIEINGQSVLAKKSGASVLVCYYDINHKFQQHKIANMYDNISIIEGAYFIKLSIKQVHKNDFMLNYGSELLEYEDYKMILQSTNEEPIEISQELIGNQTSNDKKFRLRPLRYCNFTYKTYKELIASLSKYKNCTVENLGLSCDGENSIYGLKYGDTSSKPVIMFINQHASEWKAIEYTLEFFRLLEETRFEHAEFMNELKQNFSFYFIVTTNPYGYINSKYTNFNGVNLNRNWDNNWDAYDNNGVVTNNKGISAFSEVDTQIARDKILELKPFMFIDCHTTGEGYGGIDVNKYGIYNELLDTCYEDINEAFDDSSLGTQKWNMGSSPTSCGWAYKQKSSLNTNIISTTLEHISTHIANYGTTALLYLCHYAKRYLDSIK